MMRHSARLRHLAPFAALVAVLLVPFFRLVALHTPGLAGLYEQHHTLMDTGLASIAAACGAFAVYALVARVNRPLVKLEAGLEQLPSQPVPLTGDPALDRAVTQINTLLDMQVRMNLVRERERLNLARDLHDGVLQDLIGLRLALARGDTSAAQEAASHAIRALQDGIQHIAPPELDVLGLAAALDVLGSTHDLHLDMNGLDHIPPEQHLEVYRLLEHALLNARRHGRARHVRITYRSGELTVTDDGRGCGEHPQLGLGLSLTQAHLRLRGGNLALRDVPDGCELRLWWKA